MIIKVTNAKVEARGKLLLKNPVRFYIKKKTQKIASYRVISKYILTNVYVFSHDIFENPKKKL